MKTGKSQRSTERYLEDLFEAGLVLREKVAKPGSPYEYWTLPELRQKAMSQMSIAVEAETESRQITTKIGCREYVAEKSSDSLKDSVKSFFNNHDIIDKEMLRGLSVGGTLIEGDSESVFLLRFWADDVVNTSNEPTDVGNVPKSRLSPSVANAGAKPADIDPPGQVGDVVVVSGLTAELRLADEREMDRNRHFGEAAAKLTRPKKAEPLNSNDLICHRLHRAVNRDFSVRDNGKIDPGPVAADVGLPVDLVCLWLERRGYVEIVENGEVYYQPSRHDGTEKLDLLKDLSDENCATTSSSAKTTLALPE